MIVSIIIPIENKAAAESAVLQLAPESDGDSFVVRFSATGQEPASHVGCQPVLSGDAYSSVMEAARSGPFRDVVVWTSVVGPGSDPFENMQQLSSGVGLTRIVLAK